MAFTWIMFFISGIVFWFLNQANIIEANSTIAPWFAVAFCTVTFCIFSYRQVKNTNIYILLLLGYLFRVFLLFWDVEGSDIFALPHSGADSVGFLHTAAKLLHGGSGTYGGYYTQLLFRLFQLFGEQRIIAQYFNVLLGMTAIMILLKILIKLDLHNKVIFAGIALACLFPNFAILNAIAIRETCIIALISASLYCFIVWWQGGNNVNMLLAFFFVLLASTFHSGAIAPIGGYILSIILYDRQRNRFRMRVSSIVILVVVLICFIYIYNNFSGLFFERFLKIESIEDITDINEARGGSGYNIAQISTGNPMMDLIVNAPVRMFYFITSPLPWQWRSLNDIIAFFFSSVFYLYCYYSAFKAIANKTCKNRNLIIVLLIMAFVSTFIFAWGVSNAGTALRHRDKFIIPYLIMFALCYENKLERKQTAFHLRHDEQMVYRN